MSLTREQLRLERTVHLTLARGRGDGAAVVLFPSAFGVAPDVEAQLAELAEHAALAVAYDPFDDGIIPYGDMARVMARLQGFDRARCLAEVREVVRWTRDQGADKVVMVGVCFGGPFTLALAAEQLIDAGVMWHGSRMENFLDAAPSVRCPLRMHFGSVDPVSPPAAIERIRAAFAQHTDVELAVHEGATHGFTHRSAPQAYQAAAEKAAMGSVVELCTRLRVG